MCKDKVLILRGRRRVMAEIPAAANHQEEQYERIGEWGWRVIYCMFRLMTAIVLLVLTFYFRFYSETLTEYKITTLYSVSLSRNTNLHYYHTSDMYLAEEEDVTIDVWHTIPASRWEESQGKRRNWYRSTLCDGRPIFIYLQKDQNHWAAPHRAEVTDLLSFMDYHVLVIEHRARDFHDPLEEPVDNLSTDAIYLYSWVKSHCPRSLVLIWGQSVGTGVATNIAAKLVEEDVVVDGVILEGTMNMARENVADQPFAWFYWSVPVSKDQQPWEENSFFYPTQENLKKMRNLIVFLHSEDDEFVPFDACLQLLKVAASARSDEEVRMEVFILHNGIYEDPCLPAIILKFVTSLEEISGKGY